MSRLLTLETSQSTYNSSNSGHLSILNVVSSEYVIMVVVGITATSNWSIVVDTIINSEHNIETLNYFFPGTIQAMIV